MIDHQRPPGADETPKSPCYGDARFTSTDPADVKAAKAICRGCVDRACVPVLLELRADITHWRNLEGVWDGRYYSPNTSGKRESAAECGTEQGYQQHRRKGRSGGDDWPLPKGDPCGCRRAHTAWERDRVAAVKSRDDDGAAA